MGGGVGVGEWGNGSGSGQDTGSNPLYFFSCGKDYK